MSRTSIFKTKCTFGRQLRSLKSYYEGRSVHEADPGCYDLSQVATERLAGRPMDVCAIVDIQADWRQVRHPARQKKYPGESAIPETRRLKSGTLRELCQVIQA